MWIFENTSAVPENPRFSSYFIDLPETQKGYLISYQLDDSLIFEEIELSKPNYWGELSVFSQNATNISIPGWRRLSNGIGAKPKNFWIANGDFYLVFPRDCPSVEAKLTISTQIYDGQAVGNFPAIDSIELDNGLRFNSLSELAAYPYRIPDGTEAEIRLSISIEKEKIADILTFTLDEPALFDSVYWMGKQFIRSGDGLTPSYYDLFSAGTSDELTLILPPDLDNYPIEAPVDKNYDSWSETIS